MLLRLLLIICVLSLLVACSVDGGDEPQAAAGQETTLINVDTLFEQQSDDVQVIDVRTPEEWAEGTLDGALLRRHDEILAGQIQDIDLDRPIALICRSGRRATLAGEALAKAGAADVRVVHEGGVGTWADAGYPTVLP